MDFFAIQFLNGLASASSLFLVAAGLTLIFGVTRIVNFAHGSLYMIGAYVAHTLTAGAFGFWVSIVVAALVVAVLGVALETTLLRRIYRAPELFQLLATFGVVLVVQDAVLLVWGPEDRLGPRAPGLDGAVTLFGQSFPEYELFLIALGPAVLGVVWLVFARTDWGVRVRAATEDRQMVAALGVDQARLFTSVFALGAFLAGLGGALQLPRQTIHHAMDMQIIVEAFVVTVVGGLGSVPGAFLAAVLIGELNAFGILVFPEITLVLAFLVMAVVLAVRPWGLFGAPEAPPRAPAAEPPLAPFGTPARRAVGLVALALVALPLYAGDYALAVAAEVAIFALFAASLHLMMGIGGMISFGHAAFFGLGAYGAALAVRELSLAMVPAVVAGVALAGVAALVFGRFCVRLSGVYLAMLTLAFAQILWSAAVQWYGFTGGDDGILGVWPDTWAAEPAVFYWVALASAGAGVAAIRGLAFAPLGYSARAGRDAPLRARAIGIDVAGIRWRVFALAGAFAGLAGALYAFLKGSVFPDAVAIPVSVEGLVMVLLGGIHSLTGPLVGAFAYKLLGILVLSATDYWRLVIGALIVAVVVAAPDGIVGAVRRLVPARRAPAT